MRGATKRFGIKPFPAAAGEPADGDAIWWLLDYRITEILESHAGWAIVRCQPRRGWAVPGELAGEAVECGEAHLGESKGWRAAGMVTLPVFNLHFARADSHVQCVERNCSNRETCDGSALTLMVPWHSPNETPRKDSEPSIWIRRLFCYGTLMRGECRFSIIERIGGFRQQDGKVRGCLVNLGSFPGLLAPTSKDDEVPGDLFEFDLSDDRWNSALRELDGVEGFSSHASQNSLYLRVLTTVRLATGKLVLAWVYWYVGSEANAQPIPGNSWRQITGG